MEVSAHDVEERSRCRKTVTLPTDYNVPLEIDDNEMRAAILPRGDTLNAKNSVPERMLVHRVHSKLIRTCTTTRFAPTGGVRGVYRLVSAYGEKALQGTLVKSRRNRVLFTALRWHTSKRLSLITRGKASMQVHLMNLLCAIGVLYVYKCYDTHNMNMHC